MAYFDRFQPPTLRDEPRVNARCAWCGGEIYVGDEIVRYKSGDRTHGEICESEYVMAELGIERNYK